MKELGFWLLIVTLEGSILQRGEDCSTEIPFKNKDKVYDLWRALRFKRVHETSSFRLLTVFDNGRIQIENQEDWRIK